MLSLRSGHLIRGCPKKKNKQKENVRGEANVATMSSYNSSEVNLIINFLVPIIVFTFACEILFARMIA